MKSSTLTQKPFLLIALLFLSLSYTTHTQAEVFFKCESNAGNDICQPAEDKPGLNGITLLASSVYDLIDSNSYNSVTICTPGSVGPSSCIIPGNPVNIGGTDFDADPFTLSCNIIANNDGTTTAVLSAKPLWREMAVYTR
jgi:hypothetical protein